jgi:hypothetical protein
MIDDDDSYDGGVMIMLVGIMIIKKHRHNI